MTATERPTCQQGEALGKPCGEQATHFSVDEHGDPIFWCRAHAVEGFDKRITVWRPE